MGQVSRIKTARGINNAVARMAGRARSLADVRALIARAETLWIKSAAAGDGAKRDALFAALVSAKLLMD